MASSQSKVATIDKYIASFPEEIQERLHLLRQTVRAVAPEAQEAIKYGMPTFVFHGNLVYFAAWKKHIGFYPITLAMEETIPELAEYPTSGRGTIQFPLNRPLPIPLIQKIVAARLRENRENSDSDAAEQ